MRNRLSKMGKTASWMLVLLAACGATTSCKDEYKLDDEKHSGLTSSIYSSLEQKRNFTKYLRLLGDPDVNPTNARPLTEVLSRTGSKTVFVADDEAWDAFFKQNALLPESNPWHTATSYENLSVAQKKLLIHTSMLNNAIVMENLASEEGSGSKAGERGEYMRRYTDVEATDSITHLDGNSLPVNYNIGNGETDYWSRFRTENGGTGLYLVDDSATMMVHFTQEHMAKNNVTDEDFKVIMGRERQTYDVHVYNALIKEKDDVCENGYVNITENVLTPLPNMAEQIRTNGQTRIFSHMMDRWSAPFYARAVTKSYEDVLAARGQQFNDSIFEKRYFSDLSKGHAALSKDPDGEVFRDSASTEVGLKFDPAYNAYRDEKASEQMDMAAMYVPNDETLWKYFTPGGGGWQLIQTYCNPNIEYGDKKSDASYEALFRNIDQIPLSTLRSLINIIMFRSFVSSVPSKMTKLRDDAQEQIFYPEDKQHIVGSLLANNGVVYITDKVYGPADYTSVAAPAYISKDNLVMRWAIYNGTSNSTDYMGLNYYAYLKAMQSRFVFFLPSDKALNYYYDPVSFKSQKSRMLNLYYKSADFPISYKMYDYNAGTGELGKNYNLEKMTNNEIVNRLKDILESHTIVLDGPSELNSDIDEFYVTKNGSAIRVERENGKIARVKGGFQLENEKAGITGSVGAANKDYTEMRGMQVNNVTDEQDMSNGTTYILDSPIVPSSKSVYNVLTNNGQNDSPEYGLFYDLCQTNEEIVKKCGLVDEKLTATQQKTEMKKYEIFVDDNGPDYNVQFFNNYRYTVLVPTNDAIQDAINKGLPTWESIDEYYQAHVDSTTEMLTTTADSLYLQAQITYLINFVRYHFADNSVFVDNSTLPSTDFVTASYDNDKGVFCKINVQRPQAKVLEFKDNNGGQWLRIDGNSNTLQHNIMARDVSCNNSPAGKTTMNGITIDGSSFAVIHQIPGVLNHTPLVGGRYEGNWNTVSKAKKYLKRYGIH